MQQLVTTQQQQMSTREYWQAYLAAHPNQAMLLATLGSVLSFILNGHIIVYAARWVIRVSGHVAESALLFAVLWLSGTSVAPQFVELFMSEKMMQYLVWLATVTLALIPEVILPVAIINVVNLWKEVWKTRQEKRLSKIAVTWALLFTIPACAFLILTGITIFLIASADGNVVQASGTLLNFRCLSAWGYGLLGVIYSRIQHAPVIAISTVLEQEKGENSEQLPVENQEQKSGEIPVSTEADSRQKSDQNGPASGTEIEQKIQGNVERVPSQVLNEKLEKAMAILQQNPHISDEDLAPHLSLRRPASARFWRLKAMELLPRNGEKNTDPQLPIIRPKITQKLPELAQDLSQLTKYLYSKDEAAEMAKVNVRAIEKAIKSGALLTAKNNPDQVRRSSLEKFMVQRKKTKRIHEQVAQHSVP